MTLKDKLLNDARVKLEALSQGTDVDCKANNNPSTSFNHSYSLRKEREDLAGKVKELQRVTARKDELIKARTTFITSPNVDRLVVIPKYPT